MNRRYRVFKSLNRLLAALAMTAVIGCEHPGKIPAAKVLGVTITLEDVASRASRFEAQGDKLRVAQINALEELIREAAIAGNVLASELPRADEVDREVRFHKTMFPTQATWSKFLETKRLTEAEFRNDMQRKLVRTRVLARRAGRSMVSDDELREYYRNHVSALAAAPNARGRVAVVAIDSTTSVAEEKRKKHKLEELRSIWLSKDCKQDCDCGGDDVPTDQVPTDPDVQKDPVCGEPAKLEATIGVAIENMKVGDVTPVLKTHNGLLIFQLAGYRAKSEISFEQARENIRYTLLHERRAAAEEAALRKIVCDAKPEIFMKPGGKEIDFGCQRNGATPTVTDPSDRK